MTDNTGKEEAKACCPRDSLGPATQSLDERPLGKMVEIPSPEGFVGMLPMPCYCTGRPISSAARIVVVFTDVYGIDAGRHKVFADSLAEHLNQDQNADSVPTSVILPDLFRGVPILQPWIKDTNLATDILGSLMGAPGMILRMKNEYPPNKVEADIFHLILPYLCQQLGRGGRTDLNAVQLSCVGFCFGGWVVGRILGYRQRQSLCFRSGVAIHPSFQPNLLHGESQLAMAQRIHRPILLLPARNDIELKPGTKLVDTIAASMAKRNKARAEGAVVVDENQLYDEPTGGEEVSLPVVSIEFPTMSHGWVSRGDPDDPIIAAEQEKALQLTVDFIKKFTNE